MNKLLLIEDQPQMRANLVLILQLNGFTVLSAENGREGLEVARSERPDLILCDVMMPELDGYGVLEALRTDDDTASIPFIFLTAKGEARDQRAGMKLGADDYLTKPVTAKTSLPPSLPDSSARRNVRRASSRPTSPPPRRSKCSVSRRAKRKCCSGSRTQKIESGSRRDSRRGREDDQSPSRPRLREARPRQPACCSTARFRGAQ